MTMNLSFATLSDSILCSSRVMMYPLDTLLVQHIVTNGIHAIFTSNEVVADASVFNQTS